MKNNKMRICKIHKCDKEVYTPKVMFCGEHERDYRETRKKVGYGILAVSSLIVGGLVKKRK